MNEVQCDFTGPENSFSERTEAIGIRGVLLTQNHAAEDKEEGASEALKAHEAILGRDVDDSVDSQEIVVIVLS